MINYGIVQNYVLYLYFSIYYEKMTCEKVYDYVFSVNEAESDGFSIIYYSIIMKYKK